MQSVRVGSSVQTTGHAHEAQSVERHERDEEARDPEPECSLAPTFVQLEAERFREVEAETSDVTEYHGRLRMTSQVLWTLGFMVTFAIGGMTGVLLAIPGADLSAALKDADHLISELLTAVDTSRDGRIQYDEFKRFFAGAEHELWRIFKSVDLDGNGKIDRNELRSALTRAGIAVSPPKRLDEFFRSMDKNHDGGKRARDPAGRLLLADRIEQRSLSRSGGAPYPARDPPMHAHLSRDFLLFMPHEASLRTIYSYYLSTISVSPEGDVSLSDELNLQGLGTAFQLSLVPVPIQKLAMVELENLFLDLLNKPYLSWCWPGLGI